MLIVRFLLFFTVALLVWWIYTGRETIGPVDSYVCTQDGPRCSHKWDNWKIVE
jgi:hypothetical protein